MPGFRANLNSIYLFFLFLLYQLSSLLDGEAKNYKGDGFSRAGGCGGISALSIRDPLPSACGQELTPNGRFLVFLMRPCETVP
ncbi:hypothetical protein H5410_030774 [Solanum commersonii]|uniref:Secreted protein n=1 Tax=Solanum commersonii TaxID=4109 RepID=A0A9J5YJP6_SOLCO|nr:hypothetical protein H5410_030774 [Solanum commersonii]